VECQAAAIDRLGFWPQKGLRRAHFADPKRAARVRRVCSACSRANCSCASLSRGVIERSAPLTGWCPGGDGMGSMIQSPKAVSGCASCLSAAGACEFDGQRCPQYGPCAPDYQPPGLNSRGQWLGREVRPSPCHRSKYALWAEVQNLVNTTANFRCCCGETQGNYCAGCRSLRCHKVGTAARSKIRISQSKRVGVSCSLFSPGALYVIREGG
jgi:hypothetical protein